MRALDRKLLRDLWRLKWQAAAIALLVACGVSVAVMAFSTQEALAIAQRRYYAQTRFADVFATAIRAPRSIARDLARIDGVVSVDARAMKAGLLDVPGLLRPATVRLLALPDDDALALNRLVVMEGRQPDANRTDEAVGLKTFLDAAHVQLGDRLAAVINGKRMEFLIVGSALSPEFAYVPSPASALPDDAHHGVLWVPRLTAERATGLGGAFSVVSLKLAAGAAKPAVLTAVDRLLAPYGGTPAYARVDHVSNKFQDDHIERLGIMAGVIPPVFLLVAAVLVHVVLGRIVDVEREQIGLLKAFGYGNARVASIYLKLAGVIAIAGAVVGALFGGWLGAAMTRLFGDYVRFPRLDVIFSWGAFGVASAFSVGAALAGSLLAVRRAVQLSPAVAMQAPAPGGFRKGVVERLAFWHRLDQPTRMIVRHLERFPARAALTVAGLAVSLSILTGSQFMFGSIDTVIDQAYFRARRWTEVIGFAEARDIRAVLDAARLPGVIAAEPVRNTAARIRAHARQERTSVNGIEPDAQFARPLDVAGQPIPLKGRGLVLSDALADRIGVRPGELVELEITEGRRPIVLLPVTAIDRDYAGRSVFMARAELNRLMGDGDVVSGAHLLVASDQRPAFYRAITRAPEIVATISRDDTIRQFRTSVADTMTIEMSLFLGFAAAIAFGVAFNVSRVALSERARDLATLHVLGFDHKECAYILLGELLILALLAVPLGVAGGLGLAMWLETAFAHEDLRLPLMMGPHAYGVSIGVYLLTLAVAAILVGRRIWTLDLVAVLKTRE